MPLLHALVPSLPAAVSLLPGCHRSHGYDTKNDVEGISGAWLPISVCVECGAHSGQVSSRVFARAQGPVCPLFQIVGMQRLICVVVDIRCMPDVSSCCRALYSKRVGCRCMWWALTFHAFAGPAVRVS